MSNVTFNVPAFSHQPESWHSINWKSAERKVRGLQVRIAKATKMRNWRQVEKLQRMLTRSFSAKAIAVKRVTENVGRRTPGVDGETWSTPESKWNAISSLAVKGYKAKPLRRIYIPKSNGTRRPLGIPTMRDRAMQALFLLGLEPVSETTGDRNSYGFRPNRSTADAIEQCFVSLSRKTSANWVLEGDIKGCFDNISHKWLLENVHMNKKVLKQWLNAGFMESNNFHQTIAGTPQGGIISPVLSNLALDGLESLLEANFGKKNTKASYKTKINFVRYADDFVITGISKELLENKVLPLVEAFMAERGLTLSAEKTLITHIDDGFDFLGQNIRKYNGKLLIKPSHKNLKTFLRNIKQVINDNKTVTAGHLIRLLNPKIKGWANYHRHIVAKDTFNYVDYRIWKLIWRWCKRRHNNRNKRWVKAKYFKSNGIRNWIFSGVLSDGYLNRLTYANDTVIKRHTKIKSEANCYDPEFETYFENRLERKWKESKQGKRKLLSLWLRQNHKCAMCHQGITDSTGWNIHHIIERVNGGSDELSNLVLLHPNCHRQLHHIDKT